MGTENDRIRLRCLRDELKKERARRILAERTVADLLNEVARAREFLESLPEFGCSIETTVAVQEFLLDAPHIAGKL